MEHELYVPFPVGSVRAALAEPERVARCVPGFQPDASDASPAPDADTAVAGRLRLRIAGSTITYRGTLAIAAGEDGFHVTGEGSEARGEGNARLTLTLTPRAASSPESGEGTALACAGSVRSTGRLSRVEPRQRTSTGHRLLERFGEALAESLAADPPADDNAPVIPGIPAPESPEPTGAGSGAPEHARTEPTDPEPTGAESAGPQSYGGPETSDGPAGPVFDTPAPPPSSDPLGPLDPLDPLDPPAEEDAAEEVGAGAAARYVAGSPAPAEAAHARRTMIGRSAEEVDHAPPRGRYAPEPAPETVSTAALRWAAPVAALALASAVVVSRVLRRRR
ncbi:MULTISPECIES: hypothetical protein [Streptomyces]|uniref:hypothetical protein n=1 Tax=Streptomyces TaxID=1883 RepID=UPI0022499BEA|nr:hypothetical protein [Streptomyces sp. JHD 1]MCX2971735.1 hypothetical protein [Streptomyces sp. JHD 1]